MSNQETTAPPKVCEVRIISGVTPADVETLLELAGSSGLFSADALLSTEDMAWDSAYGDGNEAHVFLLARANDAADDRIVGFLCFGPIPHWPDNYELYGIAVDPEFRRLGIGSGLVSEMCRRVAEVMGKRIFLETGAREAFEAARSFYEAAGFECEHRFHKQFIPIEGDTVYRLDVMPDESDQHYQ
jgi:ribosomal protein S18 acetylase RimI-like enzyme